MGVNSPGIPGSSHSSRDYAEASGLGSALAARRKMVLRANYPIKKHDNWLSSIVSSTSTTGGER
jgi:hypothetical protein